MQCPSAHPTPHPSCSLSVLGGMLSIPDVSSPAECPFPAASSDVAVGLCFSLCSLVTLAGFLSVAFKERFILFLLCVCASVCVVWRSEDKVRSLDLELQVDAGHPLSSRMLKTELGFVNCKISTHAQPQSSLWPLPCPGSVAVALALYYIIPSTT